MFQSEKKQLSRFFQLFIFNFQLSIFNLMNNRKWKGNTGGSFFGQNSLIFFFKYFDVRIFYVVMALIVPFYMIFSRSNCKAIYRFFRIRMGYSPCKSLLKTYKNHYIFGQIVLDRFVVFAGRKDFFNIEIVGNEHYNRLKSGEKGFIIASSHVGNYEIAGYYLLAEPKKMNALIFAGETETVLKNRSEIMSRNNIHTIPVLGDMSHLFAASAAIQNGEILSMPCDRNHGSAKSVECDFFGGKAGFPVGAFSFAANFNVEILSIFVIKKSARNYTVYVNPVAISEKQKEESKKQEKIKLLAQSFVNELEKIVRKYPEQWFNYYEFWKN